MSRYFKEKIVETYALRHGGNLAEVAKSFGLDQDGWLDLSTGISPFCYPIPEISVDALRLLPMPSEEFHSAASSYYGTKDIQVTSGSQSIIEVLPKLVQSNCSDLKPINVFIPKVGYKEHEKSWKQAGLVIKHYIELPKIDTVTENDILVVINPNNPTGESYTKGELELYLRLFQTGSGCLIVDEAFLEATNKVESMIEHRMPNRLIVLRSVGKFFGLAGIRIGFVAAEKSVVTQIKKLQSIWSVNGPALQICQHALKNTDWQANQKIKLAKLRNKLESLLRRMFPHSIVSGCDLFLTLKIESAAALFQSLAKNKIYVRLCDENDAVRFGLPLDSQLKRLELALQSFNGNVSSS